MSRCTEIADFGSEGHFTAFKSDLPHFRCRVKLRLKHPKAAPAETGRTAQQVLGAHPKNNAVCCLLHSLQD
jgi:hypothetical protein